MPNVIDMPNSADIQAGLRKLADQIDAGEHPNLRFIVAVCMDHDGEFTTFEYGHASVLEAIGALARAVARGG